MRISLAELRRGKDVFTENLEPAAIGLDSGIFRARLSLEVRVLPQPQGYHFQICLRTEIRRSCDRCSILVQRELKLSEDSYAFQGESLPAGMEEYELPLIHPAQDFLDRGKYIHDALLLYQSGRFLCAEDCRGLCPECGADLNEGACACPAESRDSPFAALASMKKSRGESG